MKSAQFAFNQAKYKRSHLSILMIDVDHFKNVNDSLGHHCGDEVLKKVAQLSGVMLRKRDILGRYGGEEFMVLLPNTMQASAIDTAQRIRLCIEQHDWKLPDKKITATVSIGVSTLRKENTETEQMDELSTLIKVADEQLYQAKFSGRNKVCAR